MKTSSAQAFLALLVMAVTGLAADAVPETVWGFSVNAHKQGTKDCKTVEDYENDYLMMSKIDARYKSLRTYGVECKQLEVAGAAAAKVEGRTVLAGLWVAGQQPDCHYDTTELQAELTRLNEGPVGLKWLVGITLGNEDWYRKNTTGTQEIEGIEKLRTWIKDPKNKMPENIKNLPLGHVDTWQRWLDETSVDVIKKTDLIGVNAFPYWEKDEPLNGKDNAIENSLMRYKHAVTTVTALVKSINPNAKVWLTEVR